MPKSLKVEDFGKRQGEQLTHIDIADLVGSAPCTLSRPFRNKRRMALI